MFKSHARNRSLISIKDMERSEKMAEHRQAVIELADSEELELRPPRQTRNLVMVYLLFLAEAIMASSLSSQVSVLVPSAKGCMGTNEMFLCGMFESAYALGGVAGVLWGCAADRLGRRRVALIGLTSMATCCVAMGFATTFAAFAILRFTAGVVSSAVSLSGLAMLADLTQGRKDRTDVVSRLPMVFFCGSLGPTAASSIRDLTKRQGLDIFVKFPGLSGQIVCASMVFMIALAEVLLLEEVRKIMISM